MQPNEDSDYSDYVTRMTKEFMSKSKDYTIEQDLITIGKALHKIKCNLEEIDGLIYRVKRDVPVYAHKLEASETDITGMNSFSGMLEFTWDELHEKVCNSIIYYQELRDIAIRACKLSIPQD